MKLKRCPFCGESAKERQVPGSFGGYHQTEIWCTGCGATCIDKSKWNQRDRNLAKELNQEARQLSENGADPAPGFLGEMYIKEQISIKMQLVAQYFEAKAQES